MWNVVGSSVTGASHRRRGRPGQDAIRWRPESGIGPQAILAVADGHGSSGSPRSGRGAKLAVDLACDVWSSGVSGDQFSERIVEDWLHAVDDELRRRPIDLSRADEADAGPGAVAYGSTLLAAVLGDDAVLMQLGDGDLIVAAGDGPVVRPLPHERGQVGEDTASLCLPDATALFRSAVVPFAATDPALVLVATDGYGKSFTSDEGFLQVASDLRRMILEAGLEPIAGELQRWLREASDSGSGDDVTVGVAWSPAAP
jgi:hypothetical protein